MKRLFFIVALILSFIPFAYGDADTRCGQVRTTYDTSSEVDDDKRLCEIRWTSYINASEAIDASEATVKPSVSRDADTRCAQERATYGNKVIGDLNCLKLKADEDLQTDFDTNIKEINEKRKEKFKNLKIEACQRKKKVERNITQNKKKEMADNCTAYIKRADSLGESIKEAKKAGNKNEVEWLRSELMIKHYSYMSKSEKLRKRYGDELRTAIKDIDACYDPLVDNLYNNKEGAIRRQKATKGKAVNLVNARHNRNVSALRAAFRGYNFLEYAKLTPGAATGVSLILLRNKEEELLVKCEQDSSKCDEWKKLEDLKHQITGYDNIFIKGVNKEMDFSARYYKMDRPTDDPCMKDQN